MNVPLEHQVSRETVQSHGKRKYRRQAGDTCSTCRTGPRRRNQRTCKACHTAYERDRRGMLAAELRRLRAIAEGVK